VENKLQLKKNLHLIEKTLGVLGYRKISYNIAEDFIFWDIDIDLENKTYRRKDLVFISDEDDICVSILNILAFMIKQDNLNLLILVETIKQHEK